MNTQFHMVIGINKTTFEVHHNKPAFDSAFLVFYSFFLYEFDTATEVGRQLS